MRENVGKYRSGREKRTYALGMGWWEKREERECKEKKNTWFCLDIFKSGPEKEKLGSAFRRAGNG